MQIELRMNERVQPLSVSVLCLSWGPESGVVTWVCAEIIRLGTPAVLLLGVLKVCGGCS